MQEAVVAAIVAMAAIVLAAKVWRALRRRGSNAKQDGCGKCGKCG